MQRQLLAPDTNEQNITSVVKQPDRGGMSAQETFTQKRKSVQNFYWEVCNAIAQIYKATGFVVCQIIGMGIITEFVTRPWKHEGISSPAVIVITRLLNLVTVSVICGRIAQIPQRTYRIGTLLNVPTE